jgi:hypothetical protein
MEVLMSKPKQIAWESWNAKIEEIMASDELLFPEINEGETPYSEMELDFGAQEILLQQQKILYTPMGAYPEESQMKPSDRWDCWLGHTNFDITNDVGTQIEGIEGVEALRVLGRYSFFIGVGRLFDIKDVRISMEKELCVYTEQEILSDENTQATVNLVKEQLKTEKYWSMLVSPEGEVDYIVSDKLDRIYLEGLNGLLERKQNIGGIILRGNDG